MILLNKKIQYIGFNKNIIDQIMKRSFYYLECDNPTMVFKYLDKQMDEGFIVYKINDIDGMIIIDNLLLDDDDELFNKLEKWDCIEDYSYDDTLDDDDDFDSFYNDDDFED